MRLYDDEISKYDVVDVQEANGMMGHLQPLVCSLCQREQRRGWTYVAISLMDGRTFCSKKHAKVFYKNLEDWRIENGNKA